MKENDMGWLFFSGSIMERLTSLFRASEMFYLECTLPRLVTKQLKPNVFESI